MEGTYHTLVTDPDPQKHKAAVIAIHEQKVRLRVCSLSQSYKSHAMWPYYASPPSPLPRSDFRFVKG